MKYNCQVLQHIQLSNITHPWWQQTVSLLLQRLIVALLELPLATRISEVVIGI